MSTFDRRAPEHRNQASGGYSDTGVQIRPGADRHSIGVDGWHALNDVELVAVRARDVDIHAGDPLPSRRDLAARVWCRYLLWRMVLIWNTARSLMSRDLAVGVFGRNAVRRHRFPLLRDPLMSDTYSLYTVIARSAYWWALTSSSRRPMQSWGTRSHWNHRDTLAYPSRSGLIEMLAAAMGHQRNEPLRRYADLEFTIRIDRPGRMVVDFHTVGGGRSRDETPPLADGGRRAEGKGTIVSHRHYLADAAFTVAVTSTNTELLEELGAALKAPRYGIHLGRRSCPPAGPLVIGQHDDPITALCQSVPIAREKPRGEDRVSVEIVTEKPPDTNDPVRTDTNTTRPVSFGESRTYQPHTTWHTTYFMPATQCAGIGSDYLDALIDFRATAP
ncbi:type I-E CRISPR-associated protein Cas5/CasD [Nocardia nepalensis]|uniref:type I-E CRISPR-associated protein Cas5/CasD n=1 Tax=Nocardia nepalensis TaxID=3375448 RepID=UPI003B66F9C1